MTRAEEASIAYQLVTHGPRVMGGDAVLSDDDFKFWNINYDFVAGYEQAEKDLALTIEAAIIVYEEWHGGTMDNFIKSMDRLGELIEPLREEMFKEEQK